MKTATKNPRPPAVDDTPLNSRGKPRKREFNPVRSLKSLETPDGAPPKRMKLYLGTPRIFHNAEELWGYACDYFNSCVDPITHEIVEPILISGLCNYLGTWRERFLEWESGVVPEYMRVNGDPSGLSSVVKRIKSVCMSYAEHHVFTARNPAGGIFVLKNYGWSDSIKIQHEVSIEHSIAPETRHILESYMVHLRSGLMSDDGDVIDVETDNDSVSDRSLVPISILPPDK